MDISTSSTLIFDFLKSHDSFCYPLDYKRLNWELIDKKDDSPEYECRAAIISCLEDMTKENMFCRHEDINKSGEKTITYVLFNSQKNSPISIEVSRQTGVNISNIINQFLPLLDISCTDKSDPDNLGEGEMILLLQLVNFLAQRCQKQEEENNKREKEKKDNKNKEEPPEEVV